MLIKLNKEVECWKPVLGYEEHYKINDKGEIYSSYKNKKLKAWLMPNGYIAYYIYKNEKMSIKYGHRAVIESFIGSSDLDCNHKDGNKSNNNLHNLEYCTKSENMNHALKTGLSKQFGSNHSESKLDEKKVSEIKKLILSKKISQRQIAFKYKVHPQTITSIKQNKTWSHVEW